MKRSVTKIGVTLVMALLLVGGTVFSQETPTLKKCCIAGTYNGENQDLPSKTCKEPSKGKFTMYIYQQARCRSKIWGKIVDTDGEIMEFEGTVHPGPGRCCSIAGKAAKPGEEVKFKAILCRRGPNWYSKDGKYIHSNGCKGTFSIVQSSRSPSLSGS